MYAFQVFYFYTYIFLSFYNKITFFRKSIFRLCFPFQILSETLYSLVTLVLLQFKFNSKHEVILMQLQPLEKASKQQYKLGVNVLQSFLS